ncbi:putative mannose-6-phosphate isomerase ManA [Pilimelia anulata]|uniref:mannose-6-phosphate isomerase n=1 Tax=Pilimelia anulata TaxID=53371 RepID=A0A8J3FDU1_9ACTN|nr:mannose-6-phosphate isomerase, class I [Pilimelia anulata]GGK05696.1 putative mannose-6-phosphate isomerase ManA [Pilimelia anulata]
MEPLVNPVREYAWGSRTVLAELRGAPTPSPRPEAELWLGAHPADPSRLRRAGGDRPLTDVIAEDPAGVLGAAVLDRFGPRLPYLMKVLAAAQPLSLQAHPDAARARERFAAGDPSYTDPHHKPELLVAVSTFRGLCGFRPPDRSAELLAALAVPALAPVVADLRAGDLAAAVTTLLTWPAADRPALLAAVTAALPDPADGLPGPATAPPLPGGATMSAAPPDPAAARPAGGGPFAAEYAMAAALAARYPADVGVVVALLLNLVALAPGEAIWMPAGNLHAYLSGTGIELMAASDNVLRGGLTPKHVDVPELLHVLRFTPLPDPVLRPEPVAPGVRRWAVPVPDFALYEVVLDAGRPQVELDAPGPRTLLCLTGAIEADDGAKPLPLAAGESAFGRAAAPPLRLRGAGTAYLATPGTP